MARQNITPDTETRQFEAYMDFSGGLNSEISNERLKPNEYPIMVNVDLSGRASARRRTGRDLIATQAGVAQGMFQFYRTGQAIPDSIVAIAGALYVMAAGTTSLVNIPITDGGTPWTFQATLPIEAVQYQGVLFVATGTKLVEVSYAASVWTAKTVTPYTPTVMEAIYIGTNGLAANPNSYVQDGVSTSLQVNGIQPATRQGAINTDTVMTAYISKPAGITSVDYQWEYKKSQDAAWTIGRVWTTGTPGKTWTFNQPTAGNYDVRVTVRDTAVPATTANYLLSSYEVLATSAVPDLNTSGIQTCRKIILHWDRLLLSADSTSPYQMYISDLENPRYFPVTNSISFDTGKQEPIRVVLRFQTYLVVMTDTTIQTLLNKDPSSYERFLIHDGIGCPAPRSAAVIGNQIVFQSFEGIQSLTPNQYRVDTMNVRRIDFQIKSEIPRDTDSCALFYDNQYWLCFPQKNLIYRYYYEDRVWVKDTSSDVAEVDSLTIHTPATTSGNVTVTLNGVAKTVAITALDTPSQIADKIRYTIFPGWLNDSSVGSRTVTFTSSTFGAKAAPVFSAGTTGTTGTISVAKVSSTPRMNFVQFLKYSDIVYNLSADGKIYKHNSTVYADAGNVYDMIVETKLHDLSASFNNKKLRRLYLIGKHSPVGDVNLKVKVYADAAVVLTPENGDYITDSNGYISWQPKALTPNFHYYTGTTIGTWIMGTSPLGNPDLSVQRASVSGKCRRVKINVTHSDPIPCELFGFGIEFKLKKP